LSTGTPSILVQANLGYGLDQTWSAYKYGFSDSNGGYWIGFENLYSMTNNGNTWKVCFDAKDEYGMVFNIPYNQYVQDSESDGYTFLMTGATGSYDFFGSTSRKYKFSTKDVNNQPCCCAEHAATCKGGWWYACTTSTTSDTILLNGVGKCGFSWTTINGPTVLIKYSHIKIKQA